MGKIITIGREFGSGGRELAKRLAEYLRFKYYDKEIVYEIAKNSDFNENYIENVENTVSGVTLRENRCRRIVCACFLVLLR